MTKKAVVTSTVGFFIVGLLTWLHGLPLAGWVGMAEGGAAGAGSLIAPLSAILVVLGVLAYLHDEVVNSVILFSFAALTWSHSVGMMLSQGGYGWSVLLWGLLFLAIFGGARKGCPLRALFALVLGLALVADAIKHWSGGAHPWAVIEGYLHLIAGVLALAKALCSIGCEKGSAAVGEPPV